MEEADEKGVAGDAEHGNFVVDSLTAKTLRRSKINSKGIASAVVFVILDISM